MDLDVEKSFFLCVMALTAARFSRELEINTYVKAV